jgi:sarcosine oxidase
MLLTGIVGGFFAAVYFVSGSLYAPMLLHALMDLHSGHMAYVANRKEDEQREARRRAEEQELREQAHVEELELAAEMGREPVGAGAAETYDVAVVGLGAIGSATLAHLQRSGLRAVGIDRFAVPHAHGSTHGESRIIREAYFEHPDYVPLVQRAYDLWRALERDTGQPLMRETGGVMIGPESGVLVRGALESARRHDLPYELLDAAEMRRRFPAFDPAPEWVGVWEPRAGVLAPEACVEAHLIVAQRAGAAVREHERVIAWDAGADSVEIATDRGVVWARSLVLAAGPWMTELVGEVPPPLLVERVVMAWFEPRDPSVLTPERCPIHLWEYEPNRFVYGFPLLHGLVKAALHHDGAIVDPETVSRIVETPDTERIAGPLARCIPAAAGPVRRSAVCLYTNTPDGHFVIDRHPAHPNVIVASACSGHGFKFAPAIGEMIARLVRDPAERAMELFQIGR